MHDNLLFQDTHAMGMLSPIESPNAPDLTLVIDSGSLVSQQPFARMSFSPFPFLWLPVHGTSYRIMLTATSITLTRRAITTRMLLEHRTNVLEDSQDPMSNAIELMPMDARDRLNQRPMGMVRSVMEFTHSTRNSWTALPKSLGRTEVDS